MSCSCTWDNLPWHTILVVAPTNHTSTATAINAKNGAPRGNHGRSGSGGLGAVRCTIPCGTKPIMDAKAIGSSR